MYSSNPITPDRTPEPPSEPEPPPPPARETRTATRRTDRPAPSLSMDDDEDDPEIMSILGQQPRAVMTNVYAPPLVSYTQAELEDMLGLSMDITKGTPRRVRRRGPPPAS